MQTTRLHRGGEEPRRGTVGPRNYWRRSPSLPVCIQTRIQIILIKTGFHLSPQDGGFVWVPAPLCQLPALQPKFAYLQP